MGQLAAYTETARSELRHSLGPFKMFVHCSQVIPHQKETNRKRTSQVVSTYIPQKSIQGINKSSIVCEVVLGCEICQLIQAVHKYLVNMWMEILSHKSWLICLILRKPLNKCLKATEMCLHTLHSLLL